MAPTVLDALVRSGGRAAALLAVHDHGRIVAAAQRSVGRPLLVSAVPPDPSAAVDRALGGSGTVASRMCSPAGTAAGSAADVLGSGMVGGALGPATEVQAFAAEGGHGWSGPFTPREQAARSLAVGAAEWLWEVEGRPAALAVARPVVAGMSRIGPAYTVPGQRALGRRGYRRSGRVGARGRRAARAAVHRPGKSDVQRAVPRPGFRPVHGALEVRFSC